MTDQPDDHGAPGGEPTQAQAATAQSVIVIGPYRLLRRLGEGGMGEVWLAEQTRPVHREVALKVIKAGMDTAQVVARFEAERQALAVMAHPAIAQVFEAGATPQGRPYFAMEYVRGEAITTYCDRHGLTARQRINLFLQVCDGVHHAHQKGIIHRDLKPSNILVTLLDDLPVPKIIDFGLAKAIAHQLTDRTLYTEVGALLGTPEYMSPEQAEMTGLDVDTRTDVYALGVILYELLTGLLPFDGKALREKGLDEMRRTIREINPPRPSTRLSASATAAESARTRGAAVGELARALRGDLDWITLRALEKDRTRRYGSVSDLAADLQRHLENVPVLASPPSVKYRTGKFVRRHRAGVTVGAVLAGLLLAFATTTGIQARRIARERDRANLEAAAATAVNEFLQNDLLAQASSNKQGAGSTPDPEIKVRTLLDRAATRIAGKFDANPSVEASIQRTIGETYGSLGLYTPAVEHLQRATELNRRALGNEHPRTLAAAESLGGAYYFAGKYPEAESVLVPTVEASRRILGSANAQTADAMSTLGRVYRAEAKFALARPLISEAWEIQRRLFGPEHEKTLALMNNLATLYYSEGDLGEAEKLLKEQLAIVQRTLGMDHPETVNVENNLAVLYHGQFRFTQAEPLMKQVLEANRRVLGPEHPRTLTAVQNLAVLYASEGRFSEAEPLYLKALDGSRRITGAEHPKTLILMRNLAALYSAEKRFAEAGPLIEKTVEISRRTLGAENPETLLSLAVQSSLYREEGRYGAAESLLVRSLEAQRRVLGSKHADTTTTMDALGMVWIAQRKYVEADLILRECVAIRRESMAGDFRLFATEAALGESLAEQGKRAEAESLLISAYAGMKEREQRTTAVNRRRLPQTGDWIIQFYQRNGEAAKAAEWKQKVEQDRRGLALK